VKLYIDCPTGLSGDMFLAGLADLGADLRRLEPLFAAVGIQVSLAAEKVTKKGLVGTALHMRWPGEQPLRHLPVILEILEQLEVSETVRAGSTRAFKRLAEVEGAVHGLPPNEIHFHEVGAVDTLVDIVGCFWALEELGIQGVTCSHLPWFQGFVDSSHGRLPLPAPATARLLQGKPVYPTQFQEELITPTGALLLDMLVDDYGPGPGGRLEAIGTGWGSKDLGQVPNGLRLFLLDGGQGAQTERIWVLESNIDHLTGEEVGDLFEVLQEAGACDVLYLPGLMKKNRPAGLMQVQCQSDSLASVQEAFFQHSLTLGIRRREAERVVLPRRSTRLQTRLGNLEAKGLDLSGETWHRPEYESLKDLARKTGRSLVQLRSLLEADDSGQEADGSSGPED